MVKGELVLLLAAGIIAASVEHWVSPIDVGAKSSAAIRTGAATYPREAIDSDSFEVRVARPVRKIVSQHWSIDEFVYSVAPPERVVAVSQSAYVESFSNVYDLARRYHPEVATDPERVLRLDPDLMMVANTSRADFCAIVRSSGVPIYRMFIDFTTLLQVAEGIRLTGYLTGEDQAAAAQVETFWSEINRAKARRPEGAARPRVLGIAGNYSYGGDTLFDDVIRTLGGINVGAEGGLMGYDEANSEQIVRWDPEWIVAGADKGHTRQELARLMADPGIALTQAARNGHIVVLEQTVFLPRSPFTRLLVTALAEALYG
jgi:iron complex transport system substrate-binding protein